jgi:PAS domain S-box-containing protein
MVPRGGVDAGSVEGRVEGCIEGGGQVVAVPRTSAGPGTPRDAGGQQRELDGRDQLYRLSFEASPVAMVVGDPDGGLLEVNDAFCALLGRRREELVGHHHDEFTHPDDRGLGQVHAAVLDQEPSRESRFEKRFLRPDGAWCGPSCR